MDSFGFWLCLISSNVQKGSKHSKPTTLNEIPFSFSLSNLREIEEIHLGKGSCNEKRSYRFWFAGQDHVHTGTFFSLTKLEHYMVRRQFPKVLMNLNQIIPKLQETLCSKAQTKRWLRHNIFHSSFWMYTLNNEMWFVCT